jgi:hypothetical protein
LLGADRKNGQSAKALRPSVDSAQLDEVVAEGDEVMSARPCAGGADHDPAGASAGRRMTMTTLKSEMRGPEVDAWQSFRGPVFGGLAKR